MGQDSKGSKPGDRFCCSLTLYEPSISWTLNPTDHFISADVADPEASVAFSHTFMSKDSKGSKPGDHFSYSLTLHEPSISWTLNPTDHSADVADPEASVAFSHTFMSKDSKGSKPGDHFSYSLTLLEPSISWTLNPTDHSADVADPEASVAFSHTFMSQDSKGSKPGDHFCCSLTLCEPKINWELNPTDHVIGASPPFHNYL